MKRKLWIGTAAVLFAGIILYGCEDFLEAPPQGALAEEVLTNQTGVEGFLISAYRALDTGTGLGGIQAQNASNWDFGSVTTDDAYKGTEATDDAVTTQIELYNWGGGGPDSRWNSAWQKGLEGANRANTTINFLNEVLETNPGEISDSDANGIRGEALFLRAHYHFDMWQDFVNIPYYTEEDEEITKSNQGVDAIGSIIDDLNEAISLLGETPRNGEVARATSWTAKAYKGKVLMYAAGYLNRPELYEEAVTVLEDVVNSGPYDLEDNYHHVWTGFSDLYNGPETIFAYQASSNDGESGGVNANQGNRLNFPHSGSPFGCCGFHQASQNIVNFFKVDANGLPLAMAESSVNGLTVFDANRDWNAQDGEFDASQNAVSVDPRLDWTVGRDGVPYKDWGPHEAGWIRQEAYGGPYSPKKNVHEQGSDAQSNVGWTNTQLNSVKTHILRYGEILLLLAEAYVETGNSTAARPLVNRIRERAGVAAQGPGADRGTIAVPIDDPSITWADYEIGLYPAGSFADVDFARAAVRAERRLELGMEGTRMYDLRRWGILEDTLNDYIDVEQNRRSYLSVAAEVQERHYMFPIPSVQIELSTVEGEQRLVQNPGW